MRRKEFFQIAVGGNLGRLITKISPAYYLQEEVTEKDIKAYEKHITTPLDKVKNILDNFLEIKNSKGNVIYAGECLSCRYREYMPPLMNSQITVLMEHVENQVEHLKECFLNVEKCAFSLYLSDQIILFSGFLKSGSRFLKSGSINSDIDNPPSVELELVIVVNGNVEIWKEGINYE